MKKISYMICAAFMAGAVMACGNVEDVGTDDRCVRISAAMADSRAAAKNDFGHEDSISLFLVIIINIVYSPANFPRTKARPLHKNAHWF